MTKKIANYGGVPFLRGRRIQCSAIRNFSGPGKKESQEIAPGICVSLVLYSHTYKGLVCICSVVGKLHNVVKYKHISCLACTHANRIACACRLKADKIIDKERRSY